MTNQDSIRRELRFAQDHTYQAHTDQIKDLITRNDETCDYLIKKLLDERRFVWDEFQKRINAIDIAAQN